MSDSKSKRRVCPLCSASNGTVIKYGFFKRGTGHVPRIQRYFCKRCKQAFSAQTGALTYRERKPHLTQAVLRVAMESVSQRGCARFLGCRPVTVARKIVRLGVRADFHLRARTAKDVANGSEQLVIFDDMETFEHSKCKPISITLAVAASTRQIVAVKASEMPAKGLVSKIAKKRYGPRKDNRSKALKKVLEEVKRLCPNLARLKSDMWAKYRPVVQAVFGETVLHERHKSRRGCVVGQGELKKGGRDPLFVLNHSCAMFRDRIKRLSRRTWCTTKKIDYLTHLLSIYAWWHNHLVAGTKRPIHMD